MPVGRTNRRTFIAGLGGAAAWPLVARGQQPAMPVVGFIDMQYDDYEPFALGLSETGYVDHRNVFIDRRKADHVDELPAIGAELGRSNVAVICGPTNAITAAKEVTSAIPMVFIGAS
jgi:putative ABC transport system substrate-binding protein